MPVTRLVESRSVRRMSSLARLCRTIHFLRRYRWSEGESLDALARSWLNAHHPRDLCRCADCCGARKGAKGLMSDIRARMVALQDELDWEVYKLYGLISRGPDIRWRRHCQAWRLGSARSRSLWLVPCRLAMRRPLGLLIPSNSLHRLQRSQRTGRPAYRDLVQRRLDLIATNPSIRLLEKPEYKRRWAQEPWEKRQERALRELAAGPVGGSAVLV